MISGSLSALWEYYGEAFRQHAHQLLAWAHADVHPQLLPSMDEPDITGLLAQAMKARLDYHPDTPDTFLHYTVGDQEPHNPGGELGNDRLRLDITLIRSGIRPRLSYVFEAKRLRTRGFPIGKYVGDGGMGDFISCRYAAEAPEAAMVGLYENKDLHYWHGELKRSFDEDKTANSPRLAVLSELSPISILDNLPGELQSHHLRAHPESPLNLVLVRFMTSIHQAWDAPIPNL